MKHLFSSGEILCKQNIKELSEGKLIGDTLEYKDVTPETEYVCHGEMNEKRVSVFFKLGDDGYQLANFRHRIGILMQSDIFESAWTEYRVLEAE